jgi:hypothetical protein
MHTYADTPPSPPHPLLQRRRRPSTTYMESVQSDINPTMRAILVDWLIEVAQEYKLSSDTLFLAAAYIDRFLSLTDVKRNRLQLVSGQPPPARIPSHPIPGALSPPFPLPRPLLVVSAKSLPHTHCSPPPTP